MPRLWMLLSILLISAAAARAEVSVQAAVDQRTIVLGESLTLSVTVQGAQNAQPRLAPVDGLSFAGPNVATSIQFVNGAVSQSATYTYRVTPSRLGQLTIPAVVVEVDGRQYQTAPLSIRVEKTAAPASAAAQLFGKLELGATSIYLGQTVPLDIYVYARQSLPVRGLTNPQFVADGLGYKFLNNVATSQQVIDGEGFTVYRISGSLTPTQPGRLTFGPYNIRAQLAVERRAGNIFEEMLGRVQVREVPISIEPVPIEVLPLPSEGRPADFNGAVGDWRLDVSAKPTTVMVGDPITLTIKLTGSGVIVPEISVGGTNEFRAHAPLTKTTANELNTEVVREIEQVLFARSPAVQALPAVRLSCFDPVARTYKSLEHPPIAVQIQPGTAQPAIIGATGSTQRPEKLGQDIVYLKGQLGSLPNGLATGSFWLLNLGPLLALAGSLVWKQRRDRLHRDAAYARRSRAARNARRQLDQAGDLLQVQRALQNYLGDRFNIPAAGITAAISQQRPLPSAVGEIFELCDAARFAGATTDLTTLKKSVAEVIGQLEKTNA